ncbi:MAG: hypothetical protein N2595_08695 [bacterium]|nr:hypothetical protein [bacterium]
MHLTVEVSRGPNGVFRAWCPELGLRSAEASQQQALDRLTSMIFEYLTMEQWHGRDDCTGPVFTCAVVTYADGPTVICSPRYLAIN